MTAQIKFFFQQMDLVSSVLWMWKKTGMMKQEDTLSVLLVNMAHRYRDFWIFRSSVRYMVRYLQKIWDIISASMIPGPLTHRRKKES